MICADLGYHSMVMRKCHKGSCWWRICLWRFLPGSRYTSRLTSCVCYLRIYSTANLHSATLRHNPRTQRNPLPTLSYLYTGVPCSIERNTLSKINISRVLFPIQILKWNSYFTRSEYIFTWTKTYTAYDFTNITEFSNSTYADHSSENSRA
jgi:hypothetical protein